MCLATAKGELSEILVVGHDQPTVAGRLRQNRGVRSLRHCFGHGEHIMATRTQVSYNGRARRLIDQDAHAGCYRPAAMGKTSSRANTLAA